MKFKNRRQAGKKLAEGLLEYKNMKNAIVLGLPRGGVPVAAQISKMLNLPLDIFLVRKLGTPNHEELAMGAIAMGGVTVLNQEIIDTLSISQEALDEEIKKEQQELNRRNIWYRGENPLPSITGKIVILIDDGLATGATMRAAVEAIKSMSPKKIVIAVPVSPIETFHEFKEKVDEIICLHLPEYFAAVGQFYEDFGQTTDDEVQMLLKGQR